jgi:hypothetical protein
MAELPMPWKGILQEAGELRNMATRLDTTAGQNPNLSEALTMVAGSVRNEAELLEVLVAIRGPQNYFPK